jgi:thiamine biosynthesis lipoprotein
MDLQRRMRPVLGTYVEAAAYGPQAVAALNAAFVSLEHAERRWSFQDPTSALSRLNASDGRWFAVDADTLRLLRLARAMMLASGGYFDFTVGGLLVQRGKLPDHGGSPCQSRGRALDLEWRPGAVRLLRPLRLTLDGIAKGYSVDLACNAMRRAGAPAGWINAGGDILAFGEAQMPIARRELDGSIRPCGTLRNAAFASSRVAKTQDDEFPAEIVGVPGCTPTPGVWSILARRAWRADALTKVAATAPAEQRRALIDKLGGFLITPTDLEME